MSAGLHALLATLWFGIEALFLIFYVVLDGFDLGVGILSLWGPPAQRAPLFMASLGNVWDANETWLVVLGGTLFGAFPDAYALILQALYVPVFLMLIGFVLRGVSFEFRAHAASPALWERSFGIGSLCVALSQGFVLGALIQGRPLTASGLFAWWNMFSVAVALGVTLGYALLGATYLRIKTEGAFQRALVPVIRRLAWAVLAVAMVVLFATPRVDPWVQERWFTAPGIYYYWIPSVCALAAFRWLFKSLSGASPAAPFVATLVVFVASFVGLALTLFPYVVPGVLRIDQAAGSTDTLVFMLAVVNLFIPVMIAYNVYLYRVFRGKVSMPTEGITPGGRGRREA